jgi:sugar phosphate permease
MSEEEAGTKSTEDQNTSTIQSEDSIATGEETQDKDAQIDNRPQTPRKTFPLGIPKRYVLLFMIWLGFINIYSMRVNLNVAIVGMVNDQEIVKSGVSFVKV